MSGNYLVTGCAGFIGAKVAELLLDSGHTVTGIDNLNDAYDSRLKQWRLRRIEGRAGFSFQRLDLCGVEALRSLFNTGLDAVINLAARAGVRQSVATPTAYVEANIAGALNLLEMCREHGVPKLVQASTSSLYGDSDCQPFNEDSPTDQPLSPYAATKKAAESLCYSYHHLHGIDITVLRFFTVYGPAGRPDMSLFRFVQWIAEGKPVTVYGDGLQSRDFTYIDDIAKGVIAGLKPLGYEIINLGSDSPVAVKNLIGMLESRLGKTAQIVSEPRHPADVAATWADIGKAARLLNWAPQTNIETGTSRVVDWYLENREWAKDVSVA